MIPLIQMLANGFLKSVDDVLGQLLARLALAESRAIIGNDRQDMGRVTMAGLR